MNTRNNEVLTESSQESETSAEASELRRVKKAGAQTNVKSGKPVAAELHQQINSGKFEPIVTEHQCNRHLSAVGDAMYVIGGKWKLRIIVALEAGKQKIQ